MKKISTFVCAYLLALNFAQAQNSTVQISAGAGYSKQTFLTLTNDATKTINNTDWDLAFTVYGQQDAGIFVNEAAASSMGQALPSVELYLAPTNVFSDVISESSLKDRLYNDEKNKSWAYGAFNETRDKTNPFDYGWGVYAPGAGKVKGTKVYVVKTHDGKYRKIEIVDLAGPTYNVHHAALDGSDEKTFTVDKTKFAGKTLAYYSFSSNSTVNLEPTGFDLWFGRYISLVTQGGVTTQYNVTGILLGRGVSAVKAIGVNPATIKLADYTKNFSSQLDTIGVDWKTVDINTSQWTVPADRAYFVKTSDNTVYKIVFIDFEGSATGVATFEKTNLGKLSSVSTINNDIRYKVFPTLVQNEVNVAFDVADNETIDLAIIDMSGNVVSNQKIQAAAGFQVQTLDASNLTSGAYIVRMTTKNGIATSKIIK